MLETGWLTLYQVVEKEFDFIVNHMLEEFEQIPGRHEAVVVPRDGRGARAGRGTRAGRGPAVQAAAGAHVDCAVPDDRPVPESSKVIQVLYKVTQHVVPNLPLTLIFKLRFSISSLYQNATSNQCQL